ncbi:MAG: hypothetical protein KTR14_02600 [Vampirovibrio sp.]|nr:hypothetical protein [Vampirovibrio sp.]
MLEDIYYAVQHYCKDHLEGDPDHQCELQYLARMSDTMHISRIPPLLPRMELDFE